MSENRPRVSIGLPVYNGERYLDEAIRSVLDQSYIDFELLISDNASTDGTEEICRSAAASDPRVVYLRNDENLGAAPNYNRLVDLSNGEYFKWIAHDDGCAPEFLEQCVRVLDNEPEVVICYSKTILLDEVGDVLDHYSDGLHLRSPDPCERLRVFLDTPGWCNPIFGLIRRSVLSRTPRIGSYPRSDRTLLAELTLHGQFNELPDYLLHRRVHAEISTEVHVAEKDLAVWFDSRNRERKTFPRWKRYSEYVRMTQRAPISLSQRAHVLGLVSRSAMSLGKVRGLLSDVVGQGKNR